MNDMTSIFDLKQYSIIALIADTHSFSILLSYTTHYVFTYLHLFHSVMAMLAVFIWRMQKSP